MDSTAADQRKTVSAWRSPWVIAWIALVITVLGVNLTMVYLAFATNPGAPEGASMTSLEGVMLLFTSPHAVLAGWVHYLVFDLFVGAWQVRDARRREIHHALVIPCLALTLTLGPVGLALYLALRAGLRREWTLDEAIISASPAS